MHIKSAIEGLEGKGYVKIASALMTVKSIKNALINAIGSRKMALMYEDESF